MSKLLESDFLTVNLQAISSSNSQTKSDVEQKNPTNNSPKAKSAKRSGSINWSKELEKRLADNKALAPESRKKDYEIERDFWLEFFNSKFKSDVAEDIYNKIGEQLRKDIKILGFSEKTNPLIAFLKLPYVQKALIKTGKLNSNTYKAIRIAVAKHYVADSEFFTASDYNIIYCADLYSKSVEEIEKYLVAQKAVLPINIKNYDVERQNRNKKIFLELGAKSVKAANAKLNSLKEIERFLGEIRVTDKTKTDDKTVDESDDVTKTDAIVSDKQLDAFVAEIKEPSQVAAALQYIILNTGSGAAKKALAKLDLQVPMTALASATEFVAKGLKHGGLKNPDALVRTLINKLATLG